MKGVAYLPFLRFALGHPVFLLLETHQMQRRMQMRERAREGTRAESLRRTSPFPLMMAAAGERESERKGEPLVARDTIYGNRPTASFKQIKVKG